MSKALKNIIAYPALDADRDKLIMMFETMKTTSKTDRFQYIRQWHGTEEVQPIDLTSGLVVDEKADSSPDTEVLLAPANELKETVENGSDVRDGL